MKGQECTRLRLGVEWKRYLKLAAVSDDYLGRALAAVASFSFDSPDDLHALNDTPEHDVLAIQPVHTEEGAQKLE